MDGAPGEESMAREFFMLLESSEAFKFANFSWVRAFHVDTIFSTLHLAASPISIYRTFLTGFLLFFSSLAFGTECYRCPFVDGYLARYMYVEAFRNIISHVILMLMVLCHFHCHIRACYGQPMSCHAMPCHAMRVSSSSSSPVSYLIFTKRR